MNRLALILGGLADRPLPELGGRTPLEAARTPNLDAISEQSSLGLAALTPMGCSTEPHTGILTLLGYDPHEHEIGPAFLDALDAGLALEAEDWVFRVDPVCLRADGTMIDPAAGPRRLKIWKGVDWTGLATDDPRAVLGEWAMSRGPRDHPRALDLAIFMDKAQAELANEVSDPAREARGLPRATQLWPWGQGKAASLPPFLDAVGVASACLVSDTPSVRGLARLAGLEVAEGFDESVAGRFELVFVHDSRAAAAAFEGSAEAKVAALESLDQELVAPALEWVTKGDRVLLVASDRAVSTARRLALTDPVPCAIYGAQFDLLPSGRPFTEADARAMGPLADPPFDLIHRFMGNYS